MIAIVLCCLRSYEFRHWRLIGFNGAILQIRTILAAIAAIPLEVSRDRLSTDLLIRLEKQLPSRFSQLLCR